MSSALLSADDPNGNLKSDSHQNIVDDDLHSSSDVDEDEVVQKYSLPEQRKIGITGSVFLILNKMIGTGSTL